MGRSRCSRHFSIRGRWNRDCVIQFSSARTESGNKKEKENSFLKGESRRQVERRTSGGCRWLNYRKNFWLLSGLVRRLGAPPFFFVVVVDTIIIKPATKRGCIIIFLRAGKRVLFDMTRPLLRFPLSRWNSTGKKYVEWFCSLWSINSTVEYLKRGWPDSQMVLSCSIRFSR